MTRTMAHRILVATMGNDGLDGWATKWVKAGWTGGLEVLWSMFQV